MKKQDKVMTHLLQMADNLEDCGTLFCDYEIKSKSDLEMFGDKIKEVEKKGDGYFHELTIEIYHVFITQIDQEDIVILADRIDDVVDGIEEVVSYYDMYELVEVDEYIRSFREGIKLNTIELNKAINLLVDKQYTKIKEHILKVKSIEEASDHMERKAMKELLSTQKDPLKIMQYKDIYEMLEGIVDATEKVAKSLELIVMKYV